MKRFALFVVTLPALSFNAKGADTPTRQFLWPKDAELDQPRQRYKTRGETTRITDVKTPYVTIHPAGTQKPSPAVIICPGGGYAHLCVDKEGAEAAPWFNGLGITTIVLAYSTPKLKDKAFADIQRAVRLARHNAGTWNIDPKRIGVMGFSAGGHLAARLCAAYESKAYAKIDDIDRHSCRPDFCILVYPAYLRKKGTLQPAVHKHIPPTIIVHTKDDRRFVPGSKRYFAALQEANIPSKLLLFEKGGHGYGMRARKGSPLATWTARCGRWLEKHGFCAREPD